MTGPASILVAGAGPAGLALALQAHDHGVDVRVIARRLEAWVGRLLSAASVIGGHSRDGR